MDILVHFRDIYIRVLSCTRSQFPFYHYWNRLEWLLAEASLFSELILKTEQQGKRYKALSSLLRSDIFVWALWPAMLSSLVHVWQECR